MKDTKFVIEKWAGSGLAKWGEGPTFSDAIRNAGIRCETCEHWHSGFKECEAWEEVVPGVELDTAFFCARHSALAEDK